MKYAELSSKSEAELRKELSKLRDELESFRVKLRLSQAKNVQEYRNLRKDIARVMTALTDLRS